MPAADDPIAKLLRDNPPRAITPFDAPSQQTEEAAAQRQSERMAEPPASPSLGSIAAQSAGAMIGAAAGPETLAAGAAGLAGKALIAGGTKLLGSGRFVQAGLQFLDRAMVSGAQLGARAGGAGLGALATGQVFHPYGETPEEAQQRRAEDFTAGVVGEGLGAGMTAGTRAAKSKLMQLMGRVNPGRRPLLEPGAVEAQARLAKFGGTMLPGQMTTSSGIDILQNIAQASITGSGVVAKAEYEQGFLPAMAAIDDAMPKVAQALTHKQAGELFTDVIERPLELQKTFVRAAYKNLDNRTAAAGLGPQVNAGVVRNDFAQKFATRLNRGDPTAARILRTIGEDDMLTFTEASDVRSMLLDIYSSRDPAVAPGLKAYAGKVAHQLQDEIEAAGNRIGLQAKPLMVAMNQARKMRTMQADYFPEKLIGPLLEKAAPEDVATTLLQHGNPSQIESVIRIINEPKYRKAIGGDPKEYVEKLRGTWANSQRNASGEGLYGGLDGARLGQSLDHSNGTWEALYKGSEDQLKTLRTSARALEMIQSRPGGVRSGTVVMQMLQGREVGQTLKGIPELLAVGASGSLMATAGVGAATAPAAGLILAAPWLTAKILASKNFSRWLMKRALSQDTRLGSNMGSIMAQGISAFIEDKIPFTFLDPTGAVTTFDPQQGTTGKYAPTGKPVSRMKSPLQ